MGTEASGRVYLFDFLAFTESLPHVWIDQTHEKLMPVPVGMIFYHLSTEGNVPVGRIMRAL